MKKYLSPVLALLAAMIWGFAFVAQKTSTELSAFTVGAVRNIFATLFLLAVIPVFDKVRSRRKEYKKRDAFFTKHELIGGAVCGIILTCASAFQQTGLGDGTDAGKAAFITALYVVLVPVLSLVFGKKNSLSVWISVGIVAVGFYLLCIKNDFTIAPSDALVLMCSFIFAGHIIAIDHFLPKCDGVRMSCIQFAVGFILNSILALIFETPLPTDAVISSLPSLIYLGICSSGIAYTLQILAQKDANPAVVSVIFSLESVFGVIGGAVLLSESMTPREYIGCVIVFIGVILAQLDFNEIKSKLNKNKAKS